MMYYEGGGKSGLSIMPGIILAFTFGNQEIPRIMSQDGLQAQI
jgi:hypothetical protein